mmetsp:Transcript_6638/g.12127  ORF Transcript_6638/g.12127 Transcript_6638/m.12127 type:complete len:271 (+) Transcript_6638:1-813(+)
MEESCFWELSLLSKHFHPSTAVMARTLLAGTHIVYDGDPLKDLSVVSFLGKFVQKKPKSISSKFSNQSDQKDATSNSHVGSASFAELDESTVNPADLFFHKYYSQKARDVVRRDAKSAAETSNDDQVDPDYSKLRDAMLANGGENSDDSGELSLSESDGGTSNEEEDEVSSSMDDGSGSEGREGSDDIEKSEDSEDDDEEYDFSGELEDEKDDGLGKDEGPFASAEDYEQQIKQDLLESKDNLNEILASDKKRKVEDKSGSKKTKKKHKK